MEIKMKNNWVKIKWLVSHTRPFIPSISLTITLGAICSLSGIFVALLSKRLIDTAAAAQVYKIVQYMLMISILMLMDVGLKAAISVITARNTIKITSKIQKSIYTRLSQTCWLDLSKYHSGNFLTRMTSDVEIVTNLLIGVLPNIISLGTMLAASIIALSIFDPFLAFLALLLGPISILSSRFYSSKLKELHKKTQEVEAGYRSFLHESIQNMVIIKAFCREKESVAQIDRYQANKLGLVSRRSLISAASNSVLMLCSWLGYFIVFGWGVMNLSKGITTFGTFTALLQLVGYIQGPFSGLAHALPQIISAFASADRLMELEVLPLDIGGTPTADLDCAGIELESVSFAYEKGIPVLETASASIHPGEITALVGSSGEGKTTLIRLLLSLVKPDKGHIYITNGLHKYEVNAHNRKLISYVPQGNTLFSGTIADNLRFGSPDASDKELTEALRLACAWEFIENLEKGLYTIIGEKGLGLSEGQSQRLAIARALLHKSPILILDEATSALDINTERKVLQAIQGLSPSRTCIVITHRMTALNMCHRIFKLDGYYLQEIQTRSTEDSFIEAV